MFFYEVGSLEGTFFGIQHREADHHLTQFHPKGLLYSRSLYSSKQKWTRGPLALITPFWDIFTHPALLEGLFQAVVRELCVLGMECRQVHYPLDSLAPKKALKESVGREGEVRVFPV